MSTLHVYDLTFISEGEGDHGGVTAEQAAKLVTAVQDSISTSESMAPLKIVLRPQNISSCVCSDQVSVY